MEPVKGLLAFREVSPGAAEMKPLLTGLISEYVARYGDSANEDENAEKPEWYHPPVGQFIVLELNGVIVAMGAFKKYDATTAELKRIWTHHAHRRQGFALRVLKELELRAVNAGYNTIYLTTGYLQPEAIYLYKNNGYQPLLDLDGDLTRYGVPPYNGTIPFTKHLRSGGTGGV